MEPANETKKLVPQTSFDLNSYDRLAGLRILIIEDMGLIAMELRLVLEKMNCDIVGMAARLSEAITLARTTERLDGVLLDLNLAGESSYPVAELLHKRAIPFIIMSGYDTSHIRVDCASDAHLQKPFSHDAVARMMLRTFLPNQNVRKRDPCLPPSPPDAPAPPKAP